MMVLRISSYLCIDASKKKNTDTLIGVFLWWLLPDLNWGHKALQASALPTELKSRIVNAQFGAGEETLTLDLFLGKEAL